MTKLRSADYRGKVSSPMPAKGPVPPRIETAPIIFDLVRRQPWGMIVELIILFVLLTLFNTMMHATGVPVETPWTFPMNVFTGPTFHFSGLPYLLVYLVLLFLSLKIAPHAPVRYIILMGIAFILLGNLGQGDFYSGFLKPFCGSDIQYYDDAIKIRDWRNWLSGFNSNQANLITPVLLAHSRVHPPFAVLLHYGILEAFGGNLPLLSLTFVLLTCSSLLIVWHICRVLGLPSTKCNLLTLSFSVIPAVNIYSAVSLDGIILATTSLFLLGLAMIIGKKSVDSLSLLFLIIGFTLSNWLSYGGVFLAGVSFLVGLREILVHKCLKVILALSIVIIVFIALCIIINISFAYNHIEGFITASKIENPEGFRGLTDPVNYLMTRLMGVSELVLFLSFGFLAILMDSRKKSLVNWSHNANALFLSGFVVLLMMFIAGAYRIGETARGCLFIYPYLLFLFFEEDESRIMGCYLFAGLQTAAMQLFGDYFW